MTSWLATSWKTEIRGDNGWGRTFEGPWEIALEADANGEPIMTREAVVFLLALPKHAARVNSLMHFNYYDSTRRVLEVWESMNWIGNLYLVSSGPLDPWA